MAEKRFKTVYQRSFISIKIERSEFLGFLFPATNPAQIKEILAQHIEVYRRASHNCYAYILGKNQETMHFSDQGEPSGTAGKPILNTLLKYELTNVLAIVTRFYGGVKLGVRGLIDAYSETIDQTIQRNELVEFIPVVSRKIRCDYSVIETLKRRYKKYGVTFNPISFGVDVQYELLCPEEFLEEIHEILDELVTQGDLIITSQL